MHQEKDLTKLIAAAKDAASRAYAPYSRFSVGAAVLTRSGEIFTGCNVENASYGMTICAERVAIFNAVSRGHPGITAIAVYTPTPDVVFPCGACRQVLYEFSREATIAVVGDAGEVQIRSLADLLPSAFGPESLT